MGVAAQAQIVPLRICCPPRTADIVDLFHQPTILPILPPMLHRPSRRCFACLRLRLLRCNCPGQLRCPVAEARTEAAPGAALDIHRIVSSAFRAADQDPVNLAFLGVQVIAVMRAS